MPMRHRRRMLPRVDDVADDLLHARAVLHLRERLQAIHDEFMKA